jgi:hypothetical protein
MDTYNRLSIESVKERIKTKHGNLVKLVEATWISHDETATFIDFEYGQFTARPYNVFRGQRHRDHRVYARRLSLQTVQERLFNKFGNSIQIVPSSYDGARNKAVFVDSYYGEWTSVLCDVLKGKGHPSGRHLKGAIKSNDTKILLHWKTGQSLVCKASYEIKTVKFLNENRINFEWQPRAFVMPSGKRYTPDLHLTDTDIWIEIKGFMRPIAFEKWSWFQTFMQNSELWDKKKLQELGIL